MKRKKKERYGKRCEKFGRVPSFPSVARYLRIR